MSVPFEIPEWLMPAAPPPPDTSTVDLHRIEGLVNRFIAAKQDALFTGPDAHYRQTSAGAVNGAPAIFDRLNALRDTALDGADDEGTRLVLGSRLDAHLDEARGGIDRHVAAQRNALNRQTLADRQTLIQRATELEHANDDKLDGLAEANAGAALELARMTGQPEGPAAETARSSIWRPAIDRRLTDGDPAQAFSLFERVKDQLSSPQPAFALYAPAGRPP